MPKILSSSQSVVVKSPKEPTNAIKSNKSFHEANMVSDENETENDRPGRYYHVIMSVM